MPKLLTIKAKKEETIFIFFIISKEMHTCPLYHPKNVILDSLICIFQDMFLTEIINLESLKWYLKLVLVSFCHYQISLSTNWISWSWLWKACEYDSVKVWHGWRKYVCSDLLCMKNINPTTCRPIFTRHCKLMLCIFWSQIILT